MQFGAVADIYMANNFKNFKKLKFFLTVQNTKIL